MDSEERSKLQQTVSNIRIPWIPSLHRFSSAPDEFRPWESSLSPSALYGCSLQCRKKAKLKTVETKWMSIKRWVTVTPEDEIVLPPGVYLSVKRQEQFFPSPKPHFKKIEYVLMMFPYGNVWSQREQNIPITESWLWEKEIPNSDRTILEALMLKDAAHPLPDYFHLCHKYMIDNPDQIGIHLKRKKKDPVIQE